MRQFHEKGKVAIYLGWQNVDGICQKQGFVKGPPFTGKWRVGLGGQHSTVQWFKHVNRTLQIVPSVKNSDNIETCRNAIVRAIKMGM